MRYWRTKAGEISRGTNHRVTEGTEEGGRIGSDEIQAMKRTALQLGFVFSVSSVTRWLEDGCGCRTTNTGHGARRNVCSAMLPASSRAKPVRLLGTHDDQVDFVFESANHRSVRPVRLRPRNARPVLKNRREARLAGPPT